MGGQQHANHCVATPVFVATNLDARAAPQHGHLHLTPYTPASQLTASASNSIGAAL